MEMDDEDDLKKMIDALNSSKQNNTENIHFDDFIESEGSDFENNANDIDDLIDDELLTNIGTVDVFNIYKHNPISSLKPDEKSLIDSCEDVELKRLLFLNRRKNINLILLYKKLQDLLMECRQYIIEKAALLKEHINILKLNHQSGGAWRLAAPYFKDKQLYQSPLNEDTMKRKLNGEIFIYDLGSVAKWSTYECEKIIQAVKLNYNFNKQQSLRAEIRKGGQKSAFLEVYENFNEMEKSDALEIPPLHSNEHINWGRIAAVFIKDKRTEIECQSMWHLYLHPEINKSPWKSEENEKLQAIVKKYKIQNWKEITLQLGTRRSELSACKHYFSSLSHKYKKGDFTYDEDKKLLDTIKMYKIGNYIQWNKVTKHFENRTRGQLHHRYTYYLSQDMKKRGKFTKSEDILLMICVDKFGKNFKKCAEHIPDRSMVQCKARYANNLQRTIRKGNWTLEEDKSIMAHVEEHGARLWTKLSKIMLRSRGQLRQRYFRIKIHLDAPDTELSTVPRRTTSSTLSDDGEYELCRSIADKFLGTNEIPTLSEVRKFLNKDNEDYRSSETESDNEKEVEKEESLLIKDLKDVEDAKNMDYMLLDFFSNSYNLPKITVVDPLEYDKGVDDVARVLRILNVDLCIPTHIENNEYLDPLDVKILHSLSSRNKSEFGNLSADKKNCGIQELVPPNVYNTVGLRSLLIKHLHFKNKNRVISQLASNVENPFSQHRQFIANDIFSYSPSDQVIIEADRNLFYRRFHALFKWPALMTLQNSSPELLNISEFLPERKNTQVKRTYSRISCREHNENAKKLKTTNPVMKPLNVLKLTPVSNKSVIQDLMTNKSKKLFSVNQINENGQVKTVINEIKLDFIEENIVMNNAATSVDKPTTSSITKLTPDSKENHLNHTEVDSNTKLKDVAKLEDVSGDLYSLSNGPNEDILEDEDIYDVQKLNIFLKAEMDSESYSDSDMDKTDL